MSAHSSALCFLVFFKQFLLVRWSANKLFLVKMPIFALCGIAYSLYKLLIIIRKSEFIDSNLLQCDTLVVVA